MRIAFGVVTILVGVALILNVGGLASWGSQDRWNKRDSSGAVKENHPVLLTRLIGVIPIVIGVVAIAGS